MRIWGRKSKKYRLAVRIVQERKRVKGVIKKLQVEDLRLKGMINRILRGVV